MRNIFVGDDKRAAAIGGLVNGEIRERVVNFFYGFFAKLIFPLYLRFIIFALADTNDTGIAKCECSCNTLSKGEKDIDARSN